MYKHPGTVQYIYINTQYIFVSLLGTCGEQVMCWRYSCQNGYAILAQAVPLWSKHSKNVPILLFAYGVFKSSGKWDGHCGFLLSDWNGNGHREWLHVTQSAQRKPRLRRPKVVTDFECDPNLTKETLAAQLQEMEKVMAHLGLDPKQETGVAASGAKPPSGFVQAASSARRSTLQTLEKETLTIHMDQNTDTFTIEGWESLVPALPSSATKYLRDITHGELRSLLDAFRSSSWTASLIAKIAEVYYISKREAAHTQMLKIRHTTQRGGSMSNLKEEDPGTSPQLVCSDCSAPWGQFSKCLLCQGSSPVDLSVTPLSVIEVEGQSWQLRITEAGPTWVPSDTQGLLGGSWRFHQASSLSDLSVGRGPSRSGLSNP